MVILVQGDDDKARRLAVASAWCVALAEAGVETSADFEAWLSDDERNGQAWTQVQAPWRRFGDQATAPEMMAARRDALEHARRRGRRRFAQPWGARVAAITASLALVIAVAGVFWLTAGPDVYRTGLGERRTVVLADGSRLAMDSGTVITVWLRRDARELALLRGQARFDVARELTRPFSVRARDQTVVATGTSFNIDLLGPRVLVTLIEGHVVVLENLGGRRGFLTKPAAARTEVRLRPGEQLVAFAASSAPPLVEKVSLEKSTSWETGQLVFDNEPLAAVAERISRYATHPIVVRDPAVASVRISGVFKSGDIATFVDTVTRYLPVTAVIGQNGAVELLDRS